jgi:hypothetical protein
MILYTWNFLQGEKFRYGNLYRIGYTVYYNNISKSYYKCDRQSTWTFVVFVATNKRLHLLQ